MKQIKVLEDTDIMQTISSILGKELMNGAFIIDCSMTRNTFPNFLLASSVKDNTGRLLKTNMLKDKITITLDSKVIKKYNKFVTAENEQVYIEEAVDDGVDFSDIPLPH